MSKQPPKLIPRDPQADRRTLEFMQQVAVKLNGMLITGELVQNAAGVWTAADSAQAVIAQQVFGRR